MSDAEDIMSELVAAEAAAADAIGAATDLEALRAAETGMLGRRSQLGGLGARLGALDPAGRREVGAALNAARGRLEALARSRRGRFEADARAQMVDRDRLDLTEAALLGPAAWRCGLPDRGRLHLVTRTRDELEDVFVGMGFRVVEGSEAETDWYNFEALNMPPAHPARSMWDTLYLDLGAPDSVLLRTHTSPVQVHLLEAEGPPVRAVMPGRCYRKETPDARHLAVFHQIEGLVVDEGIGFCDLAGTVEAFTRAYFGEEMHTRLRPSFFPFTEPSAEMDVTCPVCAGAGCRTCSASGWIELGGCGMVDPNVLVAVGVDPERWTGFAFGFGIDRLAMIRSDLEDLRALTDNDLRFLHQV